jgi:hypothetical protein
LPSTVEKPLREYPGSSFSARSMPVIRCSAMRHCLAAKFQSTRSMVSKGVDQYCRISSTVARVSPGRAARLLTSPPRAGLSGSRSCQGSKRSGRRVETKTGLPAGRAAAASWRAVSISLKAGVRLILGSRG